MCRELTYLSYKALLFALFGFILASCANKNERPSELLANVVIEDKSGFITANGEWKIKPVLPNPTVFTDGLGLMRLSTSTNSGEIRVMYGFIDLTGNWKIMPSYLQALPFTEALAAVKLNNGWGFIDTTGKVIIKPQFESIRPFKYGTAAVKKDGKWGYINTKGDFVIEPKFQNALPFNEGLAAVQSPVGDTLKWGYINEKGINVIAPKYDYVSEYFDEDLALASIGKNYGFIDKDGKEVIPFRYNFMNGVDIRSIKFKNGIAPIIGKDSVGEMKWGFINKSGEVVIPCQFNSVDMLGFLTTGLIAVGRQIGAVKKYGFINGKGEWVIKDKFMGAHGFQEGLASVIMGNQYGFINPKGDFVIKPRFDYALPFAYTNKNYFLEKDYRR